MPRHGACCGDREWGGLGAATAWGQSRASGGGCVIIPLVVIVCVLSGKWKCGRAVLLFEILSFRDSSLLGCFFAYMATACPVCTLPWLLSCWCQPLPGAGGMPPAGQVRSSKFWRSCCYSAYWVSSCSHQLYTPLASRRVMR